MVFLGSSFVSENPKAPVPYSSLGCASLANILSNLSRGLGSAPPFCGLKLNRRGKPQVLVSMFPLTRVPYWNSGFLSHSHFSENIPHFQHAKNFLAPPWSSSTRICPGATPNSPGTPKNLGNPPFSCPKPPRTSWAY